MNVENRYRGRWDVPLDAQGYQEAVDAARALSDAGLTAVYAGPLRRTIATAQIIADEAGVPVVPEMKGQVETGQTAPDVPKTASVKIPVAININLSLPHPGAYGIIVTAGSSTAQLSFEAIFAGQKVEFTPAGPAPERGN
jgi:hypothetical protein